MAAVSPKELCEVCSKYLMRICDMTSPENGPEIYATGSTMLEPSTRLCVCDATLSRGSLLLSIFMRALFDSFVNA